MTPDQAAQQRALALHNALLGLERLPSHELGPDGTRASAILLDLQQRIRRVEEAEAARDHRPTEPDPREPQVQELMAEMAARGLNRI